MKAVRAAMWTTLLVGPLDAALRVGVPDASDRCAYVADTVNRRVMRVKLAYAAEETCAAP